MFSMPKRRSRLRPQHAVLFDDLVLIQRPLDGHLQFLVDQRLGEEIEGPEADRLDGRFDGAVAGDHDDGAGRLLLPAVGKDVESVVRAEADVDQRQVVGLPLHGRGGLGHIARRVGLVSLAAEPVGHRGRQMSIVVHQEQSAALLHRNTRGWNAATGLQMQPMGVKKSYVTRCDSSTRQARELAENKIKHVRNAPIPL